MWILIIRSAVSVPQEYILEPGITTLGRGEENAVCLADDSAAPAHAEITFAAETNAVTIRDLGSASGTLVNQVRVERPQLLSALDVIQIGETAIQLDERKTSGSTTRLAESTPAPEPLDPFAALLCEVGERLNLGVDLDTALNEVADLMRAAMGADKCKVILASDFHRLKELGFPTSIAQRVISQRAPVLIANVQRHASDPTLGKSSLLLRIRSVLCAPVLIGPEVGGLIYVYKTDPAGRPFDQRDLQLAVGIGHQAALTIQRARVMQMLEPRVAARTQELATLYNITSVASEWLDLTVTLDEALAQTLKALDSEKGAIYLLDDAEKNLRLAVQQGLSPEMAAHIEVLSATTDLTGDLTDGDQPRVSLDLGGDARPFPPVLTQEFRVYAGAPLRARGKRVGALCVFDAGDDCFSPEAIALLSTVADQIGVVVENTRLRKQAEQAAVTQERGRLARELHDSVTQSLYTLNLFAGAGRQLAATGNLVQLQEHLDQIGALTQETLKEMRLLVHQLRFPPLNQEGLVAALRRRFEQVERPAGVEAQLKIDKFSELPVAVEEGLYWIALESLNNALKHAQAKAVTVHVDVEETSVKLAIADNGHGFEARAAGSAAGLGLVSMQERAKELGGTFDLNSAPGEGTRVTVQIPLEPRPNRPTGLKPVPANL